MSIYQFPTSSPGFSYSTGSSGGTGGTFAAAASILAGLGTALQAFVNVVQFNGSSTQCVSLNSAVAAASPEATQSIINATGGDLLVYPPAGQQIGSLGPSNYYTMSAGQRVDFVLTGPTQWYAA